ncbi:MAG TPA: CPBP family intramembrane glutamic endopeptidase [Pyrinomonadaceae bacterium]|jgi:membrane protease YdiL (CAAX protease family)|nr:CPBP family intramembrane glutamic endopeptidase [Pyrinomonadaceae bacterium]
MISLAALFKKNLWTVFLFHQLIIFLTALGFLSVVRNITGRNIHLGQDPVGVIDGIGLVVLSVAVIVFTVFLYRWAKGNDAPPLGIALSLRRVIELIIGLLIGFGVVFLPWAIALWTGAAVIAEQAGNSFNAYSIAATVGAGFFLLLIQAVTEETANRAFPIRLWQHRSLLFRVLVPSIFFVTVHLVSEPLSFERAGILLMAGILQSFAYLITGNIWFSSGIHAGANYALFSISGLWHAGALVRLEGQPAFPNWAAVLIMLAGLSAIYFFAGRQKNFNHELHE